VELVVRAGEREEQVDVRRTADGYEVRLGDRSWTIRRAMARGALASLLIDGRQFEVVVRPSNGGEYRVTTAHGAHLVEVIDPLAWLAQQAHSAVAGTGQQEIAAYMPGRVVTVLVEEGEAVEAGQGLVVLEAMKMENEIQAEFAGTVEAVHVAAGDAVEGGQALVTIGEAE
jgi:biotin carboxyl carrier protein